MATRAELVGVGLVTPVGMTAASVAAAVRAGISRVRETPFWNLSFRPHLGAFVPEDALPPTLGASTLPGREQRMVRLAVAALREAAHRCARPPPLFLGMPYEAEVPGQGTRSAFLDALVEQSGVILDVERSRCFALGRAAGLLALAEAVRALSEGRMAEVLVGGVDSLMDPAVLATLESEERLRRHGPTDGLRPGEGAAFLHLCTPGEARHRRWTPLARVMETGRGREPGHRYSQEPYLGEGLSEAFQALFETVPSEAPAVQCVYAGFNGESFWAKEWGVALLRARERFAEEPRMEHPAENVGDPGAAYGPLMVGLAALGMRDGYREGPSLVWCSSDREERGAVLLSAATQEGLRHGDG